MTNNTNSVIQFDKAVKDKEILILKGESYKRDDYNEVKKLILESDKSVDQIVEDSVNDLVVKVNSRLTDIDNEKINNNFSILGLPSILDSNPKNNRFIQIDENKYILSVFKVSNSYNILYLYEYLSSDQSLTLIFRSNQVANSDISFIKNMYSWDIIWNHKTNNYELFWINNNNHIYWSSIDKVNKTLLKYRVITTSNNNKTDRLSVCINTNGDRNIFTTHVNSTSKKESIAYTHIYNTESWIETIIKSARVDDYLAYGRQVLIDNIFYQVFHNKNNNIYICKLQIVSNSISFNITDIANTDGTELLQMYYEITSIDGVTTKGLLLFSHNFTTTKPKMIIPIGQTFSIDDIRTFTQDINVGTEGFFIIYRNNSITMCNGFTRNLGNSFKLYQFKRVTGSNLFNYMPYYPESMNKVISNIGLNSSIIDLKQIIDDNIISEK